MSGPTLDGSREVLRRWDASIGPDAETVGHELAAHLRARIDGEEAALDQWRAGRDTLAKALADHDAALAAFKAALAALKATQPPLADTADRMRAAGRVYDTQEALAAAVRAYLAGEDAGA